MRLISSLNINSYKMEFIDSISDTCMFRTKYVILHVYLELLNIILTKDCVMRYAGLLEIL